MAQHVEELRREDDIAIPLAFPLLDADDHPTTVDVGGSEVDGFRDAEAGGRAGRHDGPVLGGRDAVEHPGDFLGAEHDRKPLRLLRRGDQVLERPRLPEGDLVETRSAQTAISSELGASFLSRVR
jgi:hypothetical protein